MAGTCLICYDIADPKRLARFHRWLSRRAVMLQYSVYLAHPGRRGMDGLVSMIGQRIHPDEDDVRVYPVPEKCEAVLLGDHGGLHGNLRDGIFVIVDDKSFGKGV